MDDLGQINAANAQGMAEKFCGITGVPIEARWHAAEAFCSHDNLLSRLSDGQSLKNQMQELFFEHYIADGKNDTHGTCWKIWELLGVGPETGFSSTPKSAERLLLRDTQKQLKILYQIVFDNDRAVYQALTALPLNL